jgi:hypothetical protein
VVIVDDVQRALGKLEGRFDGLDNQLEDIKRLIEGNREKFDKIMKRVDTLEKTNAHATGFVAAVSVICGVFASWAFKKFGGIG